MSPPLPAVASTRPPASGDPPAAGVTPAALAQIVARFAPALNESLAVVIGRVDALLETAALDAPARAALGEIYAAAERADGLLRRLRACGGGEPVERHPLDLGAFVEEHRAVLQRCAGGRGELRLELAPELPVVAGDAERLGLVLIALVQNAAEAQPAGGAIVVSTAAAGREAARAAGGGEFAVLSVADCGPGIAADVRLRLFEPFFTTKPGVQHLGLGLAVAAGIAGQHGGWIDVESAPGAGATFRVFLPVAAGALTPERASAAGGRREVVLLVDDDTATRETVAAMLARGGYRVLQAGSTDAALETWRWHRPRIRLLLTDVVLDCRGSGLELAARLRAEKPALAVVCTSGYGRDILAAGESPVAGAVFLAKPCRPQALLHAVRTVLDAFSPP